MSETELNSYMTWFDIIPIYFKHIGWYAGAGFITAVLDAAIRVFILNQGDAKFNYVPLFGFIVGVLLTSSALVFGIIVFSLGLGIPAFASGGKLFSRLSLYFAAISGTLNIFGLYVISAKTSFDWPIIYGISATLCVAIFYLLVFGERLITKAHEGRKLK